MIDIGRSEAEMIAFLVSSKSVMIPSKQTTIIYSESVCVLILCIKFLQLKVSWVAFYERTSLAGWSTFQVSPRIFFYYHSIQYLQE
jgi:hypothetical protein